MCIFNVEVVMKVINLLPLLMLFMVLSSCSASNVLIRGDDLLSNELCGEALYGTRPCLYVKELNFHLDGSLYGDESFNSYDQYLRSRVAEMNKNFSHFGTKVNFKKFPENAWFGRPKENDSNIEVTFLLTESSDKKIILITFYTFSKGPFYIKTGQCPSNEKACVIEEMKKLIDGVVIKSMTQDGN